MIIDPKYLAIEGLMLGVLALLSIIGLHFYQRRPKAFDRLADARQQLRQSNEYLHFRDY